MLESSLNILVKKLSGNNLTDTVSAAQECLTPLPGLYVSMQDRLVVYGLCWAFWHVPEDKRVYLAESWIKDDIAWGLCFGASAARIAWLKQNKPFEVTLNDMMMQLDVEKLYGYFNNNHLNATEKTLVALLEDTIAAQTGIPIVELSNRLDQLIESGLPGEKPQYQQIRLDDIEAAQNYFHFSESLPTTVEDNRHLTRILNGTHSTHQMIGWYTPDMVALMMTAGHPMSPFSQDRYYILSVDGHDMGINIDNDHKTLVLFDVNQIKLAIGTDNIIQTLFYPPSGILQSLVTPGAEEGQPAYLRVTQYQTPEDITPDCVTISAFAQAVDRMCRELSSSLNSSQLSQLEIRQFVEANRLYAPIIWSDHDSCGKLTHGTIYTEEANNIFARSRNHSLEPFPSENCPDLKSLSLQRPDIITTDVSPTKMPQLNMIVNLFLLLGMTVLILVKLFSRKLQQKPAEQKILHTQLIGGVSFRQA